MCSVDVFVNVGVTGSVRWCICQCRRFTGCVFVGVFFSIVGVTGVSSLMRKL